MQRLALALYQLAGTAILPLLVLALLIRSRKQPEYRSRLLERLGFCPPPASTNGIVIHGSSLGEITSLKPFITAVIEQFPGETITVTSFTPAGSTQVKHLFNDQVNHTYLPVDSFICNWIFLKRLQPRAIVFMETELWPSLSYQAQKANTKLLLINARLSERSTVQYRKILPLIKLTLNQFDAIQAQSPDNEDRILSLGANPQNVTTRGNLKFDIAKPEDINKKVHDIKIMVGSRPVWVIGSTHTDEEDLLLNVFHNLKQQMPTLLLVIAPRHAERYSALEQKIKRHHLTYSVRSKGGLLSKDADTWLIDTVGELLLFYAVGDICTVAGSFDNTGGHNTLEPALFGKAITVGPQTMGTPELTEALLSNNALLQHNSFNAEDITRDLLALFESKQKREELGNNANIFLLKNRGATQQAITTLINLVG